MAIDWSRIGAGIERAGGRWSSSIMRELEASKAEHRARRMFSFRLGEETKARKSLMEEGNRIALELKKGKASLESELQATLGSPQLRAYLDKASQPGEIGPQMQAIGARDLIGRLQRFERPKPEDIQLLKSLPLDVQAPMSTAMGQVSQYYQKEDFEREKFERMGKYHDAQTSHLESLTDALKGKAAGGITREQATKALGDATGALAALQKDEYYRFLLRKVSREEELKPEEKISWSDYMKRTGLLRGTIAAMGEMIYGKPTPRTIPTAQEEPAEAGFFSVAGEGFYKPLEKGRQAAMKGLGEAGKWIYELLTKGWSSVKDEELIKSFKKTFIESFK